MLFTEHNINIQSILKSIPPKPGVYLFYDNKETIIYVGKAKNLKNRVKSYFGLKSFISKKHEQLVKNISDIKYFIVSNEHESLLLENNFIKNHNPKYNVQLKDDKTFPWICITNDSFPKVFYTRLISSQKNEYFGPYTSLRFVNSLLRTIRKQFKIRTCNLALTEETIKKKKFRLCLEYHMKNCLAPCENLQPRSDYLKNIEMTRKILRGNIKEVIDILNINMQSLSQNMHFEEAQKVKETIYELHNFYSKTIISSPDIKSIDVFSLIDVKSSFFINYLKIKSGAIVHSFNTEVINTLNDSGKEVLPHVITSIRDRFKSDSPEIIVPFKINFFPNIKITVPKIGDKKKLLEFSERNAKQYMLEKKRVAEMASKKKTSTKENILVNLKSILSLPAVPNHIECFDNSNIQGTSPVASCVVFKNGIASKHDFRHFNIKTVVGANDFASIYEVLKRRYSSFLSDNLPLPDLIIIDGGKGQLNAALDALKDLGISGTANVIGIAKRFEDVFAAGNKDPLVLDKKSSATKLLLSIRNEAHRFALSFHKKKRSEKQTQSFLNNIKGIGPSTVKKLIDKFGSPEKIKKVSLNELSSAVGAHKANLLFGYFNSL